ncbi:MAG: CoA transferase [Alphaproteobacteria bacterium]|nr:CoA transferase [Alphaproteobacteria bacterium]
MSLPFLVVELGTRIACGACGSLLAQCGATVGFVEAEPERAGLGKFAHRTGFSVGKLSIEGGPGDRLRDLIGKADAVLVSSDLDPAWIAGLLPADGEGPAICDITAFGQTGPLAGRVFSDGLLQAITGVMDTTGRADGPPRAVAAPILEFSAAFYAAAALLVSLGRGGGKQAARGERIDIALYDCGINALATFLPAHFGGLQPGRIGNRHPMAAPWNAYRAADGWVLICSTDDRQWQRICAAIGQPGLASDRRFDTLRARMERRGEVDAVIEAWIGGCGVDAAVQALNDHGVACGPIVPAAELAADPNLRHRGMVRKTEVPGGGAMLLPASLIRFAGDIAEPLSLPRYGKGWRALEAMTAGRPWSDTPPPPARLPLEGIRVVEIGQYTTAPLAGRHLAMLGAEVLKIEPPDGDPARQWAPHRDGLSYFFVLSNSGKRSIAVDLRTADGAAYLRDLIARSDILVENMKPGSLARLGFDPPCLAAINPRLIYCAVSGFGADAAYPGRPAFDTVIQAMSGVMDLTRDGDLPLKAGISIADICGGELALLAILAALEMRKTSGKGLHADLAMQDAAAWLTQLAWNGPPPPVPRALACADGYVAIEASTVLPDGIETIAKGLNRAAMAARLAALGIDAAPVRTVGEAAEDPQTRVRELIVRVAGANGAPWPLLRSPLRFAATPTRIGQPIGSAEPPTDISDRSGC